MVLLRRSKILLFVIIGTAIGIGSVLWHSLSNKYFVSLPVTYNEYNYPLVNVKFGADTHALAIRIGSRFPLFLNKEILDKIDKKSHGTSHWQELSGEPHQAPTYLIPKIKIGNLILTNTVAIQMPDVCCGILGKYLGDEFNLLLDFAHSRIIACDSFSKLKVKKLANDHWIQVPFETSKAGVILQVDTDLGTYKLALNTTASAVVLRTSLIPSKEPFLSSTFCLGKQEFGNISLKPMDFSCVLDEIDGFIGMNFLKNHAIYLDYFNKIAYIEPPQTYFERLPVTFNKYSMPATNVVIEDNTHLLGIDLGFRFPFSLNQEILQNIHKTSQGISEWGDFKGNQYESPMYTVPKIKIGNLTFVDVFANQDNKNFHSNTTVSGPPYKANTAIPDLPDKQTGLIGRPILEKYNLFLDFRHSVIYASNNYLSLQQAGLLSKNLLIIPFVLHQDGILLSVKTDTGIYNLILDTGATWTVIRSPHSASTSQFRLIDHDFGERAILPLDLDPSISYDGYLGMDFLLNTLSLSTTPTNASSLTFKKIKEIKNNALYIWQDTPYAP